MASFIEFFSAMASMEELWISNNLIYNKDGDIIGKIQMHYKDSKTVFVDIITIYPEFRNNGYFRQIVYLLARCSDLNKDTIRLIPLPVETDEIKSSGISITKLQDIYKSYGFIPENEEYPVSEYTKEPKR